MKRFKRHRDYGFFDQDIRLSKLSELGDPLEKLGQGIDFEIFRAVLEEKLFKHPQGKGGRPPYDYVLMFKILILQRYYNLSDDQVEYQINDRMSFMRFLDLSIADDIPDSKTVWNFREQLILLGAIEELFALFTNELEKLGLIINKGKIVDASFIEVPKQRNSREENQQIKEGKTPESFLEQPAKLSQKDLDARWTKKNGTSYFGYKFDLWCALLDSHLCQQIMVPKVFHTEGEIKELLGRLFQVDGQEPIWPISRDSPYYEMAQGYQKLLCLLMHATYKLNDTYIKISQIKYCELLKSKFSPFNTIESTPPTLQVRSPK